MSQTNVKEEHQQPPSEVVAPDDIAQAVKNGDADKVREWLEGGGNANAVVYETGKCCTLSLGDRIRLSFRDRLGPRIGDDGSEIFLTCAKHAHYQGSEQVSDSDPDAMRPLTLAYTLLYLATQCGGEEGAGVLRLLLENGADVRRKGVENKSPDCWKFSREMKAPPLESAVRRLSVLYAAHPRPGYTHPLGLDWQIEDNDKVCAVINALLDFGADDPHFRQSVKDPHFLFDKHYHSSPLYRLVRSGNVALLRRVLKNHPELGVGMNTDETESAGFDNIAPVDGAAISKAREGFLLSALHTECVHLPPTKEVLQLLLHELKAPVTAKVLHYAAQHSVGRELFQVLLDHFPGDINELVVPGEFLRRRGGGAPAGRPIHIAEYFRDDMDSLLLVLGRGAHMPRLAHNNDAQYAVDGQNVHTRRSDQSLAAHIREACQALGVAVESELPLLDLEDLKRIARSSLTSEEVERVLDGLPRAKEIGLTNENAVNKICGALERFAGLALEAETSLIRSGAAALSLCYHRLFLTLGGKVREVFVDLFQGLLATAIEYGGSENCKQGAVFFLLSQCLEGRVDLMRDEDKRTLKAIGATSIGDYRADLEKMRAANQRHAPEQEVIARLVELRAAEAVEHGGHDLQRTTTATNNARTRNFSLSQIYDALHSADGYVTAVNDLRGLFFQALAREAENNINKFVHEETEEERQLNGGLEIDNLNLRANAPRMGGRRRFPELTEGLAELISGIAGVAEQFTQLVTNPAENIPRLLGAMVDDGGAPSGEQLEKKAGGLEKCEERGHEQESASSSAAADGDSSSSPSAKRRRVDTLDAGEHFGRDTLDAGGSSAGGMGGA